MYTYLAGNFELADVKLGTLLLRKNILEFVITKRRNV